MHRLPGFPVVVFTLALAGGPLLAADSGAGASYSQQLTLVYGTYQSVLANKEVCDLASPNTRGANEKSYTAWRSRNAKTIAELDDRVARMIRGASRDEKEYARNVGKYEGAILQQRQEAKQDLLSKPKEELQALCKTLPELMASRDNDLEMLYAEELKSIRSRR